MKSMFLSLAFLAIIATSCTISYPGIATGNTIEKTGTASRKVWFGIAIRPVDLSIETAAKNAGITKIATVDYSVTGGLFTVTYKVTVTGN
jgi:hypothetical protein